MIGHTLDGRYEIVEEVGRGGIGVVYRARQLSAKGRDVAVKVLLPAAQASQNAVTRFENEAAIIGTLRHPNTIRMFDTGRTPDGRLYVVTEFLVGETLMDRIERGALSQLETVKTLIPIARSLEEAHARGIVHRDLKLANIFLERVGEQEVVKVLDFGIAKLVDHERITAPMQIFGTPGYMAPEQCRGGVVGPSADLFALGVLAYVALALRFPYDGNTAHELLLATLTQTVRPLSETRPEMAWEPALEGLVMQLLAYDPEDRPHSAAAAADAFENVLKTLDHTAGVVLPGRMVPLDPEADTPRDEDGDGAALDADTPRVQTPRPPDEDDDDAFAGTAPSRAVGDRSSRSRIDAVDRAADLRRSGRSSETDTPPMLDALLDPEADDEPGFADDDLLATLPITAVRGPREDETTPPLGYRPPGARALTPIDAESLLDASEPELPSYADEAAYAKTVPSPHVLRATVPTGGAEPRLLDTLPLDDARDTVKRPPRPTVATKRLPRRRPDVVRNVMLVLGVAAVVGAAVVLALQLWLG